MQPSTCRAPTWMAAMLLGNAEAQVVVRQWTLRTALWIFGTFS